MNNFYHASALMVAIFYSMGGAITFVSLLEEVDRSKRLHGIEPNKNKLYVTGFFCGPLVWIIWSIMNLSRLYSKTLERIKNWIFTN